MIYAFEETSDFSCDFYNENYKRAFLIFLD